MGQYFKAVNLDREEVVCPWCISGGAKFSEWCSNGYGAVWNLLLRQSDTDGSEEVGDSQEVGGSELIADNIDARSPVSLEEIVTEALEYAASHEGDKVTLPKESMIGRWACQRVMLLGDYDESGLWHDLPGFRNISREVVEEWNRLMPLDGTQLEFNEHCSCNDS